MIIIVITVIMTFFSPYVNKLLAEIKTRQLSPLDNEIIGVIKNRLFNQSLSNKAENIYKKTFMSIIKTDVIMGEILVNTLSDYLFEDMLDKQCTQLKYIYDEIAHKIMYTSKCFDITLQCEDEK